LAEASRWIQGPGSRTLVASGRSSAAALAGLLAVHDVGQLAQRLQRALGLVDALDHPQADQRREAGDEQQADGDDQVGDPAGQAEPGEQLGHHHEQVEPGEGQQHARDSEQPDAHAGLLRRAADLGLGQLDLPADERGDVGHGALHQRAHGGVGADGMPRGGLGGRRAVGHGGSSLVGLVGGRGRPAEDRPP
jgi:hypothetical protein